MSQALRPLFVTVTWGASGSTSSRSLELAEICQRQLGLTTCLHLTCTNMSKKIVDEALEAAKEVGIRNILALRGDPPRGHEYRLQGLQAEAGEDFVWAVDLVKYIRAFYGDYFCIGVAGYPEGHSDESCPANQDPKHDMPYLVEKVQAGADFIMTQLFYHVDAYLSYERLVREWNREVLGTIPIIPGLMPIQSYQTLKRTTKLSHAKLSPEILMRLEPIKGNDEEVKKVGVDILSEIVTTIKNTPSRPQNRPRGFHFYTLNLEKAVGFILERCALIPPATDSAISSSPSSTSGDTTPLTNGGSATTTFPPPIKKNKLPRRPSSPHNHIVAPARRPSTLAPPTPSTTLSITHGIGSLGREATWDDYPNGRFGDARSPAYAPPPSYSPLHLSPPVARQKWDFPTRRADISRLFERHICGELDALPWSEGPLSAETAVIREELCELISRGWWSVASQPAVDGIRSSDPTFGWGPSGGFVFQKAFVELFVPAKDWLEVLRPKLTSKDVEGEVSWYASPCPSSLEEDGAEFSAPDRDIVNGNPKLQGFESSSPSTAVNSVTWGAFPGKEIVTPTIIEEVSFRAWVEEAFTLWREWERCHAVGSESRKFLRREREGLWLINVIGHGYREPGKLWDILIGAQ